MTEQNINTKSQLAKLLATENISFQHSSQAKTAYFDVKNRLLVLPVWKNVSNDLYDMLIVHEVGHALDTPADAWLQAIKDICVKVHGDDKNQRAQMAIKGFLNVIEDARIDKRQKRRYPGSRRNYVNGHKDLFDRDFFNLKGRSPNDLSFIDRINILHKGGSLLGIKFSNEERPLLKKVENAETFDEVIAITEEIYRYSREKNQDQMQTLKEMLASGEGDGEADEFEFGEDDDADDFDDGDDGEFGEDGDEESDGDGSESESASNEADDADESSDKDSDVETKSSTNKGQSDKDRGVNSRGDDYIPESETDRAWEENVSGLAENDGVNYIYVELPKPDVSRIVDDYKVVLNEMNAELTRARSREWMSATYEKFQAFKNAENATISYMVKEFETRKSAETYAKISVAKTGMIDTNKLHSYRYNDDIFRRLATIPKGKNHGFVMFLDWSGSMQSNLLNTVKQLISLTMFCKRVQIPFEVYTFRDLTGNEYGQEKFFSNGKNEYRFENFKLRNVLSSRMNLADLNTAYMNLWCAGNGFSYNCDPLSSTPLDQAIVAAEPLINKFRKDNRLEIVNTVFLTDGDASGTKSPNIDWQQIQGSVRGHRYILRDNVSKKEYKLGSNAYEFRVFTTILLKILRDRTNSNMIGFFLCDDRPQTVAYRFCPLVDRAEFLTKYREDGFIAVTSEGYDEYYVINTRSMKIEENTLKIDTSTMSRSKITKEFMKFNEKKSINRVLLSRFIDKISSQKKKVA